MPLPHSEHFGQTSECSQQPLVPVAQSPDLALAYWQQLQPELSDTGLQQFSQQFASNPTQPIGIYTHSNSEEGYSDTPESAYWGASSCPSETASASFPPQLLDRRGSLPPGKLSDSQTLYGAGSRLTTSSRPHPAGQDTDRGRTPACQEKGAESSSVSQHRIDVLKAATLFVSLPIHASRTRLPSPRQRIFRLAQHSEGSRNLPSTAISHGTAHIQTTNATLYRSCLLQTFGNSA